MRIKGIEILAEKTQEVRAAARVFEDATCGALAEKFALPDDPAADEPPLPDWRTLQRFIVRRLELERARLRAAASAYEQEIDDDPRKREERDEVAREAYDELVRVRHVLRQAVGETKTRALLGIKGRTPERPLTLLMRLRAASCTLRDAWRLPETLRVPGMRLDWEELADSLENHARRLGAVLAREGEDRRRADLALIRKNEVQASVNDTYVGFAKILEGMYIAAGERELAGRLRPPTAKASAEKTEEVEEPRPEAAGEPERSTRGARRARAARKKAKRQRRKATSSRRRDRRDVASAGGSPPARPAAPPPAPAAAADPGAGGPRRPVESRSPESPRPSPDPGRETHRGAGRGAA
jgi:hypothetical protein